MAQPNVKRGRVAALSKQALIIPGENETEIIPNLFIGDLEDAKHFGDSHYNGVTLCVLESLRDPDYFPDFFVPVVNMDMRQVDSFKLDICAYIIEQCLQNEKPVLVHCGAGVERSPLATAWFLNKKRKMTLDKAYELIKQKRPIVIDRRKWLEEIF